MSTAVKNQPIAGLAPAAERTLDEQSPSLAAAGIGRSIGSLLESIPLRIGGIKLSYLLFGPVVIPFALIGWTLFLVSGEKYVVTNRQVQIRQLWGRALRRQVSLADIADVVIHQQAGQQFFHAADLHLLNTRGESLLTLPGVDRPERLRHVILDARAARLQSDAALKTIQARR